MNKDFFDLTDANYAYMLGLFQTDGHMKKSSRNRGTFSIEMRVSNRKLFEEISEFIPYNYNIRERTRDTNFKDNYTSVIFRVCSLEFRTILNSKGIPYGAKSEIVKPPTEDFSKPDYYRGLVDGDGSLGITSRNLPFVSFTTKSQKMCDAYVEYIEKITGCRKVLQRNKRDDIYNIILFREPAQIFVKNLYYSGCNLCIEEKREKSLEVLNWEREYGDKYIQTKRWEDWEDEFILSNSVQDSMKELKRTKSSITTRLWRLKNNKS